jgi:hypothetical protein
LLSGGPHGDWVQIRDDEEIHKLLWGRAKAAKIGFRQVNTGSSLESKNFYCGMEREKPGGNPEMACSSMLLRGDSSSAALQHYTASWLSRHHEQSRELGLLEPLSFGQRWRSRACIFQEFGWTLGMLREVLVVPLWTAWCSHLSTPDANA